MQLGNTQSGLTVSQRCHILYSRRVEAGAVTQSAVIPLHVIRSRQLLVFHCQLGSIPTVTSLQVLDISILDPCPCHAKDISTLDSALLFLQSPIVPTSNLSIMQVPASTRRTSQLWIHAHRPRYAKDISTLDCWAIAIRSHDNVSYCRKAVS